MIKIVTILTILSLLTSCTANYFITIRQDNTATVDIDRDYDLSDIDRYNLSDIITSVDTNAGRVKFDISNIDSIGNYLPFHPKGFVQFKMVNNLLTITDGNTKAFKSNNCFCCAMGITIKFEKDIEVFETANKRTKKKDNKTIVIYKTRRQLIKGKKKTNVTTIIK